MKKGRQPLVSSAITSGGKSLIRCPANVVATCLPVGDMTNISLSPRMCRGYLPFASLILIEWGLLCKHSNSSSKSTLCCEQSSWRGVGGPPRAVDPNDPV